MYGYPSADYSSFFKRIFNTMQEQPSRVASVTDDQDLESKIDSAKGGLVVVDFWATWCGPCRRIAPFYEDLSRKYEHVLFLKVDADECPDIVEKWMVRAFPSFLFFKDGLKAGEVKGADANGIEQQIQDLGSLAPGVVAQYWVQSGQAQQAGN